MSEYSAIVNDTNRARAQSIRSQYTKREATKLENLQKLDGRVKAPGRTLAAVMGSLGALVMGSGMSLVMVWGSMPIGLVLGIGGMLLAALAYPVYMLVTGRRRKKYAAEIIRLSDELMAE